MGGLESFGEAYEDKKKRKPKAKKETAEKSPALQKEKLEALLKFCELDSSSLDKVCDAVEERLKNPRKFIPEKDRRAGCRAEFIGNLNKILQPIKLPKSPAINVLGVDMPVFFDRERFENLQKYCIAINNVLKGNINPLYRKNSLSDQIFRIPFFDFDMCLNYGWLVDGDDVVEYSKPDALTYLWDKKIEKKSTKGNKKYLQEIYENAADFDPSNEPASLEEFETIIDDEFGQMIAQIEESNKLIDLNYGHLIGPDYFIAILSKEVLGNPGLTMKARRFLLNNLLDRGNHNLTLIPALHDREASFGIYQTIRRTHDSLSSEFGGFADFPPFEECLGFREQTRTMVWLIYTNMRAVEQFTFRIGPKNVRENRVKLFQSVGRAELKKFFYKALAIMHNRGMSAYSSAVGAINNRVYKTFSEFETALFGNMKDADYGNDVNFIISN